MRTDSRTTQKRWVSTKVGALVELSFPLQEVGRNSDGCVGNQLLKKKKVGGQNSQIKKIKALRYVADKKPLMYV